MLLCYCSANSTRLLVQDSSSPSLIAGKRFPSKAIQFTLSSFSPPTISFSTKSCINTMDSVTKSQEPRFEFLTKKPYLPPSWASHLNPIPSHVFSLGHFPTPIHQWKLPNLPRSTEVYIKDACHLSSPCSSTFHFSKALVTGPLAFSRHNEFAEFPMAKCRYDFDAVAQGADCIITIGGIQSNHCRATAVAAKYLNLDCYLILRTSKVLVDKDPGLSGNLLVERLVGAHIDLVSKEEYAKVGSVALTSVLKEKLLNEGRKPYVIPVGGSNSLGTWGYIEAIKEIKEQCGKGNGETVFDDIVVACGSGGTIAGLSVGCLLSDLGAQVHAYCVCDDPDYFYDYSQGLLDGLQAGVSSRDIVRIQNAKGLGYAMSSAEELKFASDIAAATGVVLDPVYSGKAAYGMMKEMAEEPEKWEGRKILFIHTGGLLGLFDKADEMAWVVGKWRRMDIHASVPRKEGTGKMF